MQLFLKREGASDTEGVRSFARDLVSAGFPAAVGMREPVTSDDASLFTQAFYGALVEKLSTDLRGGKKVEIEITAMLWEPRQALRDKHVRGLDPREAAAAYREWTNPVLYVRPEPLRIRSRPAGGPPEIRSYLTTKLGVLDRARSGFHADTPPEVLEEIDAEIEELLRELTGG